MKSRMLAIISLASSVPLFAACDLGEESEEDGATIVAPNEPTTCDPTLRSWVPECYTFELQVTKTAEASYVARHTWDIDKSSPVTDLVLSLGQTYEDVPYTVAVYERRVVQSGWALEGTISIYNPAPVAATVTEVSDTFGTAEMLVTCPAALPIELEPFTTLTCTYAGALAGPWEGTNTAVVTTRGTVAGGEGSAEVVFGEPESVLDACVTVTDTLKGVLGEVCVPGATFQYTRDFVADVCDPGFDVVNVATFVANDSGATGSDDHVVHVTVPCAPTGCTLTPGYWKTHSDHGPAPYDDTWALVGPDTAFYLSGMSWYEVLWTAPKGGNAYFILAHPFIAATLNGLSGADTSAVAYELDRAGDIFATYTPADIGSLKGGDALRGELIGLAGTLGAYDEGSIGPGHCSE